MFNLDDDYVALIDERICQEAGREEIQLYEQMLMAMELSYEKNFEIVASNVTTGVVRFEIATQFPDGLPVSIGTMFFNINKNFDVKISECKDISEYNKRFFDIILKKV